MLDFIIILLLIIGTVASLFGIYTILIYIKQLENPAFWRIAIGMYFFALIIVYFAMVLYYFQVLKEWGWLVLIFPIITEFFGITFIIVKNKG